MVRTNQYVPFGFGDERYDLLNYTDLDAVLNAMESIEPLQAFAALWVNAVVAVSPSEDGAFHVRYVPHHKVVRVELDPTSYIELDPQDEDAPLRIYDTRLEAYLLPQSGLDEWRLRRYLMEDFRSWWRLVESLQH